ncbi:MAG: glycosyltransferase [candidate division WOR-3 bacterium]|nr:glycosyltransferase [candidate division WOR-3 bacterium]
MLSIVIFGLAVGFALFFIGYSKNMLASRGLKEGTKECDKRSVVVVMATRNEERVIEKTIRTLFDEAPPSLRTVVVDESSDATYPILDRLATEFPNLVVVRHEGPLGKPSALNIALDRVTEDIVLFLDADARFSWTSIKYYMKAFSNPKVNAVFADFASYNKERTLAVMLQDVYFSFAKAFVFSGLFSKPIFMNSGFFVRREVFDIVGKFDPKTIVDDFDLRLRMGGKNFKARFIRGPKCGIQYAFHIKDMLNQHCRWFTGWIRKIFEQIGKGRYSYVLVLGGIVMLVFFPYIVLLLAYVLRFPFFLNMVLPLFLSVAYSASLSAYLFYEVKNWREAFVNAFLGMFVIYVLLQITIVISFIKAFRRRQAWYKVRRERA